MGRFRPWGTAGTLTPGMVTPGGRLSVADSGAMLPIESGVDESVSPGTPPCCWSVPAFSPGANGVGRKVLGSFSGSAISLGVRKLEFDERSDRRESSWPDADAAAAAPPPPAAGAALARPATAPTDGTEGTEAGDVPRAGAAPPPPTPIPGSGKRLSRLARPAAALAPGPVIPATEFDRLMAWAIRAVRSVLFSSIWAAMAAFRAAASPPSSSSAALFPPPAPPP